jgi:hypothetical protein
MFFTKGEPERHRNCVIQTLEVEHYVFGLKCLVPAPHWLVRNPG